MQLVVAKDRVDSFSELTFSNGGDEANSRSCIRTFSLFHHFHCIDYYDYSSISFGWTSLLLFTSFSSDSQDYFPASFQRSASDRFFQHLIPGATILSVAFPSSP
jgi:hypothetical protein